MKNVRQLSKVYPNKPLQLGQKYFMSGLFRIEITMFVILTLLPFLGWNLQKRQRTTLTVSFSSNISSFLWIQACKQYNLQMRNYPKAENGGPSEQDTTSLSDNQSVVRQPLRRFNRSNTHSRSKSKQDEKEQLSSRFFIRSICSQTSINPEKTHAEEQKLWKMLDKAIKREDTPVKSRKTIKDIQPEQDVHKDNVQKEMEWLKLERRCQLAEAENLKLFKQNNQLKEEVNHLRVQLSEAIHQKLLFEQKMRHYEQTIRQQSKQRPNNLIKLKREIAKQRDIDSAPPIHILQQQLQTANSELSILRDSLARSERMRKQAQDQAQIHRSQRESFLENLVQQLRAKLSEKGQILDKLKIQLNIFRVRQAKRDDKVELIKNEELQTLKRKYGNVLKKYHTATQELAAYRRKEQRLSNFLCVPVRSRSPRLDTSLSLSP